MSLCARTHSLEIFVYPTVVLVALGLLGACTQQVEPPYSAQDALKTFELHPDFEIELFVSEPEVKDPVAMALDRMAASGLLRVPGTRLISKGIMAASSYSKILMQMDARTSQLFLQMI